MRRYNDLPDMNGAPPQAAETATGSSCQEAQPEGGAANAYMDGEEVIYDETYQGDWQDLQDSAPYTYTGSW